MFLYWFDWSVFQANYPDLMRLLSLEEQQKAARFKFVADQSRYTICRGILRLLLADYLQQDPQTIQFCYHAQGKPLLDPQYHASPVYFNVSHSQALGLIGISEQHLIGVDVEYQRSLDWQALARRFFSPAEQTLLDHSPLAQQELLFFQLWTAKEAYLKAIGTGLSGGLDQVQIALNPLRFQSLPGDPSLTQQWQLQALTLQPDYAAAVAIAQPQPLSSPLIELTPQTFPIA
ncbi:MAG: 4'-phosphopantetheinyl transferase family protein [Microcystaceae cyanobacterium]